jgi:hypothetical protein
MSSAWHRLAENRINEAIERGEFSDVPSGQPLDLSEYFAAPAEDRMAMSLLRSADVRPAEVDLLKEIAQLEARLAGTLESAERTQLAEALQTCRVTLALTLERRQQGRRGPRLA